MDRVSVEEIRFDGRGLVPAVIQEANSGRVLMVAYMNAESLQKTLETGQTWFYSRSRQELWHKGETSGHFQKVVSAAVDCDADTLLFRWNRPERHAIQTVNPASFAVSIR